LSVERLFVVRIGNRQAALEAACVRAVLHAAQKAVGEVEVLEWDGHVLPVLPLPGAAPEGTLRIVLEHEHRAVAVAADGIEGMRALEVIPGTLQRSHRALRGACRHGGEVVPVFATERLLDQAHCLVAIARADPPPPAPRDLLLVRIGGEPVGLPLAGVVEVSEALPPVAVPGAPRRVSGVVQHRGAIVPVLRETDAHAPASMLVFVRAGFALQVDAIEGIGSSALDRRRVLDPDAVIRHLDRERA
jgi:hypothetical protein